MRAIWEYNILNELYISLEYKQKLTSILALDVYNERQTLLYAALQQNK